MKISKEQAERLIEVGCSWCSVIVGLPSLPICEGDDTSEMFKRGYSFATKYNDSISTYPTAKIKFEFQHT